MNPSASISFRIHQVPVLHFYQNHMPQKFDKGLTFWVSKYGIILRSISLLSSLFMKSSCFSSCRIFILLTKIFQKSCQSNHSETQMLNLCDFSTFLIPVPSKIHFHHRFGPFFQRNTLTIHLKCLGWYFSKV